jgi:hypothetical protein
MDTQQFDHLAKAFVAFVAYGAVALVIPDALSTVRAS